MKGNHYSTVVPHNPNRVGYHRRGTSILYGLPPSGRFDVESAKIMTDRASPARSTECYQVCSTRKMCEVR
jgi:hypothetical protein